MTSKRPRNADFAVFERLAERIEQIRREFAQFVQKKRTEIGEGDFAGASVRTSSNQASDARSWVYGNERTYARKRVFARFSSYRANFRERKDFRVRSWREDSLERATEKGFS